LAKYYIYIIEEFEIKEEIVSFKEEIFPSSTVEDTCTVNINRDVVKMENTGIQGKIKKISYIKLV